MMMTEPRLSVRRRNFRCRRRAFGHAQRVAFVARQSVIAQNYVNTITMAKPTRKSKTKAKSQSASDAIPHNPARHFVFRKYATVGAADAMEDSYFLQDSFFDNGAYQILSDKSRPQCLILGRTGSGKTALIEHLDQQCDTVIRISPEGLALTYISNSDVLNFFIEAGVDMDLFYRLLWRHVFTVEIIKEHFHIVDEVARDSFITRIKESFKGNRARRDAIDYLTKMGASFWQESEYRVTEVTQNMERDLKASVEGAIEIGTNKIGLNAGGAQKLTEEQKLEVVHRGKTVVDKVQMSTLSNIIDILGSDVLNDDKKTCYITIDRLDDNWVDEKLRYQLIKALIDTVRDFNNKIRNLKILVAIREDLLERVFALTRGPGHQEEKYNSLCLRLTWRPEDLVYLLDLRIEKLVKEQYTTRVVKLRDVLPENVSKMDSVSYLLERTLLRPRDAIMFLNECINTGEGKARLTQSMIYQSEESYSDNRLRALADEWSTDYPNLMKLCLLFKKFPVRFRQAEIIDGQLRGKLESSVIDFLTSQPADDIIFQAAHDKWEHLLPELFHDYLMILFRTGVIGIKPESFNSVIWSYKGERLIGNEISASAMIHIHPAFWRVLGTQMLTS